MVGRKSVRVAVVALMGVFALPGCADTCEDLQRLCNRCLDPNQRAACEAVVDSEDAETCQEGVDDYTNVCK